MSNKKYGVGIIGAGWVSGEYVKAFRDHPLTEVVGIYNKTPGKPTQVMQTHGVEGREYESLDEFFNDDRINIVVSCTHPDVRAEHSIRAAETGRHIVLEKPVGVSLEDTARIRDAVNKAGVKTVTSFVLRWNPQFETVVKLIRDQKILGELIYGEADYWHPMKKIYPGYPYYVTKKHAGSSFVAAGCHAADMLRYLGGEIVEVAAFSTPGPKVDMNFEYSPITVASLKFANGAVGKLSSLVEGNTRYLFNCRLFGTEGTIQNNRVYSSVHYPGALDYWSFPTIEPDSGDVSHHPFIPEVAHFMECIENNVESHASIYDSFKTMALVFAIDESAAKGGQPVKVRLE
jgi:predicted dehydrogenase